MTDDDDDDEIREKLAEFVHDMWATWMIYLFHHVNVWGNLYHVMDGEKVARWKRQMRTAYCDLPEEEKNSDREIADRLRKLLDELRSPEY